MNKIISSVYTYIFAGLLFLGCTFWIYNNVRLEDLVGKNAVSVPLPTQSGEKYEIRNNDVVKVVSPDAVKLIIDGEKLENMDFLSNLSISPDGSKMCFLVHTITPIWLYTANIDGSDIRKVSLAVNCVWSLDSTMVAYNNHTTDVSNTDVYVYYLNSNKSTNLTNTPVSLESVRIYETPEWLSNSKIKSAYTDTILANMSKKVGTSTIDVPLE